MKRFFRLLCLLMCLTLLPVSIPAARAEDAPAPDVRVLLRRLNLTDRADLILDGAYTAQVDGSVMMSFPRGAEVTILIREGDLYLFYAGFSLRVGREIIFVRNQSSDEVNGIRFEKAGALYPGTLRLTVDGSVLRPILTINVEEYLLGVVPYEMSEYFPLEALKAQAVCARTYALNKIGSNKDYDLVDTTNDQVFKGVNYAYVNAIRAVRETAGIVGTWNGQLAICYYSASNGGQTELVENVWSGRGDWGYYQMVDDPYDLENPESIVRTARIAKDRSEQIYRQATATLADATARVDETAVQIAAVADSVKAQLDQLQTAVENSKASLTDAAAIMAAIRPEDTEE